MRFVIVSFSAAVLTFSGARAEPLPQGSFQVAQASSCSAWRSTCNSRCSDNACRKNVCGSKFSACLKSGCWSESAQHGGGSHCSLAKK